MAKNNFFKPSLWDLIGAVTGIVGVAGIVRISLDLDARLSFSLIGSAAFLGVGAYALRAWLYDRDFPFKDVTHHSELTFRIEGDGDKRRVVARLKRETSFAPRFRAWKVYDRKQFITELSPKDGNELINELNHKYKISIKANPLSNWQDINSVKRSVNIPNFREMKIAFDFPEEYRASRYKITEEMDLQNDFSEPLEYYDVEISEPAKSRSITLVFDGFEINSARALQIRGTRKSRPRPLDVQKIDLPVGRVGSTVHYEIRGGQVGSKISLRWDWPGVKGLPS